MNDPMTVSELTTLIQTKLISRELKPDSPVEFDIEGLPRFEVTKLDIAAGSLVLSGEEA